MVFLGPSKGCRTCKHRRKKCDETRPSCMRCVNSGRTCAGYQETCSFVQSQRGNVPIPSLGLKSMAEKCSLPVRKSSSPDCDTGDEPPKEFSSEKIETFVLCAFFYEYCAEPINNEISRGYLHGLEPSLTSEGMHGVLAKACRAVALASHSISLNRPSLMRRAEAYYQGLLGVMAERVATASSLTKTEKNGTIAAAILLGQYEIMRASDVNLGSHELHASGVAALLHTNPSICGLIGSATRPFLPQFAPKPSFQDTFYIPGIGSQAPPLDTLILESHNLLSQSQSQMEFSTKPISPQSRKDTLLDLHRQVLVLDHNLRIWGSSRHPSCKPQPLFPSHSPKPSITGTRNLSFTIPFDLTKWGPGKVHTYCDIYIAAVWNMFRTTRLQLISLKIALLAHIHGETVPSTHDAYYETEELLQNMLASIPYFLTKDLDAFSRVNAANGSEVEVELERGRIVGGLLLMHPLFLVAQLPITPSETREFIRGCLGWIGEKMGIGMASIFARAGHRYDFGEHWGDGGEGRVGGGGGGSGSDEIFEVQRAYVESSLFLVWAGLYA